MGWGHLAWVPLASTPFRSQAMPSWSPQSTRAVPRGGKGEGGGGALGLSRSHGGAGGRRAEVGRPLPGTQGLNLSVSLAWE